MRSEEDRIYYNHEAHGDSRRLVDRGGNAASPRKTPFAASPSVKAPSRCGSEPDGVRQPGCLPGLAEPIRRHAGSVLLRALRGFERPYLKGSLGYGYAALGISVVACTFYSGVLFGGNSGKVKYKSAFIVLRPGRECRPGLMKNGFGKMPQSHRQHHATQGFHLAFVFHSGFSDGGL
jgi:hypothetical protein